jgi:hypothetical protein
MREGQVPDQPTETQNGFKKASINNFRKNVVEEVDQSVEFLH